MQALSIIINIHDMKSRIGEWKKAIPAAKNVRFSVQQNMRTLEWIAANMTRELNLNAQFNVFPGSASLVYVGSEASVLSIARYCETQTEKLSWTVHKITAEREAIFA